MDTFYARKNYVLLTLAFFLSILRITSPRLRWPRPTWLPDYIEHKLMLLRNAGLFIWLDLRHLLISKSLKAAETDLQF
ncbi:hypothetical protein BDV34DRAFT_187398 [Aspergillus parasiticus]|uniref:Uncharacterized protein n=1 Tax=Aspergillus parasiticus TaxID=5067 RepID=A0A5N6DYN8_ASPPA|nr:hypothetical protein BDV34DRAFT_187398 [Aspergillus parasiticus]